MDLTCELLSTIDSVALRPVQPGDEAFLFELYASTRREEMALAQWDTQQEQDFLRQQFDAQSRYYGSEYPGAKFFVILVESAPAGRLYVHHRLKEVRVMEIALLPEYRRRGIGSSLLREILDDAASTGKAVTIHVEIFNPALRLYQRLGFKKIAENGPYYLMEWRFDSTTVEQ